jgi:hypothetical protein
LFITEIKDIEGTVKACFEELQDCIPAEWKDVTDKWRLTRSLRIDMLKKLTFTNEYFQNFPCLKQPLGYELVS